MSSRRQLMMIVAIVFAALAAASVYAFLGQTESNHTSQNQLVDAYVLQSDFQRLDPGSKVIAPGTGVKLEKVPVGLLPNGRFTKADGARLQQMSTRIAAYDLKKGQILVDSMLVDQNSVTPQAAYRLDKDMVAVSISVDDVHASGGNLQPGDFVNILASLTPAEDDKSTPEDDTKIKFTFVAYQKVKILYIGRAPAPQPGDVQTNAKNGTGTAAAAAPVGGSGVITFEVPPDAASRIVALSDGGGLTLTLVNPDYKPVEVPVVTNQMPIPDKVGYQRQPEIRPKSDLGTNADGSTNFTPYPQSNGPK